MTSPNYLDIKTKTYNWCDKMRKTGLLTSDQFDQCIASFRDPASGVLSSGIESPATGNARAYSLYTTKRGNTNLTSGTANSQSVILLTMTGQALAVNTNNAIYFANNINDSKVNQREMQITLIPQSENKFAILSPYGKYLVANQDFTTTFTSTSIGPMSTWQLSTVNDKITIQSIQFPEFYLSFDDASETVKLIYGTNDGAMWSRIDNISSSISSSTSNNTLGSESGNTNLNFIGAEYQIAKENMLAKMKTAIIGKMLLDINIRTLQNLSARISDNYADIVKYINQTLSNAKNIFQLSNIDYQTRLESITQNSMLSDDTRANLISSINRPSGMDINEDIITMVLNSVIVARDRKLADLDKVIKQLQVEYNKIDINAINTEYTQYIASLQNKISELNNTIDQNNIILARHKSAYSTVNSELNDNLNNINASRNKGSIATTNIDILNNYNSQNSLLLKLYPAGLLILFCIILYFIYTTYGKFITNVYNKY